MSEIPKTIGQYRDFNQLQEFAVAQQSTIIQLTKKITKLEEERDHLKKLLESTTPIIPSFNQEQGAFQVSSEEAICTTQLSKLRDISMERELTLEEARRVEIFSKVLNFSRNTPKTVELEMKKMSNEELLALVESDNKKENVK